MTLKAIVIDLEMVEVELLLNRVLARLRRIHIKLESSPYRATVLIQQPWQSYPKHSASNHQPINLPSPLCPQKLLSNNIAST